MHLKKLRKLLLLPVSLLIAALFLTAPKAQAASKKTYIIGTDQTFKPFEIQDKEE